MFVKAQRQQAKLRLAICGPSGSGKTYSALQIARGLAPEGQIAMIDTERGSGSLYADLTEYDIAPISPPFTPKRYIELIQGAAAAGYKVLIIDSLSHAWCGEGGVLELVDRAAAASRSGNSFMAWREVTPHHNALVDAILGAELHIIATLRTKTAYDIVDNGKGKKEPIKIGLAPVQRDGLEYEFTLVMDLSVEGHVATATKDRTRLFDGLHFIPTPETGESLSQWLAGDAEAAAASRETLKRLVADVNSVDAVPALTTWWRGEARSIATLSDPDRAALTQHCAIRKRTLEAEKGKPARSKGNGRKPPAVETQPAEAQTQH
ncbi:MAG: ATP-binding protein [Lamprobacter sp.]|uniref:ATP-binding protein n=1 Tax=Lamprobacter sp. TaxID=3100796 RepID=UPI002B25B698|nr:ATP-binding protein [Lamprobacter sp.]MEA3641749.1 ATP-binding protein [Lamprobacter sp.]